MGQFRSFIIKKKAFYAPIEKYPEPPAFIQIKDNIRHHKKSILKRKIKQKKRFQIKNKPSASV